jgi:hypothetical protein
MSNVLRPQHAFNHAPAALRIFRFAADSAPRVLEIAHVSAFLRECAVEFGSADAALPGALRCEYAVKRFFKLRAVVERNAARCPWLAEKLLACRSGAPVPAAALAPDVTRHDVNWGAQGARRNEYFAVSGDGSALTLTCDVPALAWSQGAVGVTRGKHFFQVCVTRSESDVRVGWVDSALRTDEHTLVRELRTGRGEWGAGDEESDASGAVFVPLGRFDFGTAPLPRAQSTHVPGATVPCTVGCLLDVDAGAMTVFVDGEPLAAQCQYKFPADGRKWYPTVALYNEKEALFSTDVCAG